MEEKIMVKRKRKIGLIIIPIFLILFFMLYFILEDFGIYVEKQRTVLFNEPHNVTRETIIVQSREIPTCEMKKYRYSTEGGNVDLIGNSVRPNLKLFNLENKWGEYKVNFSFIDESKFPYEEYGGHNLLKRYASGDISWEDGDFFSKTYYIMMPPQEGVLIDDLTKATGEKVFWAIANIIEPEYEYCYDRIEMFNNTQNKTFTEYLQAEKLVKVHEYTKILDILHIESFGQWILIVMMCFLIVLLAAKITCRLKDKRSMQKILKGKP